MNQHAPTTILVTGAGGGIGRQIAVELAGSGHRLVLTDHATEPLEQTAALVTAVEGAAAPVALAADISEAGERDRIVDAVRSAGERLVGLVNCAGVLRDARLAKLDDELFSLVTAVNLVAPLDLVRKTVDLFGPQGGSIVSIGSRAWLGTFGSTAYSGTKGALVGASRSLALELGPRGITVNIVAPGFIESAMTAALPEPIRERSIAAIPVGRPGRPDDVARTVRHLLFHAPYTTGQVLVVCGGRSIGSPLAPASSAPTSPEKG
ncbi:SDR family NAD(P)-dependent oxidoreductase [Micromonospora sp. NPDC049048]|uniref:SDR family NAD(P)-dependent oxidoreductase n=1 Tax=Micromonospora sp. NPDC049048 TaxID=3364263 RepID=UPI0037187FD2